MAAAAASSSGGGGGGGCCALRPASCPALSRHLLTVNEDVAAALCDGYAKWRSTRTIPDIVGGNANALAALKVVDLDVLAEKDVLACLFIAELAVEEGAHERAAQLYVAACAAHPSLIEASEFEEVDAACQFAELGALQDVLKSSRGDACALVTKALRARQDYFDAAAAKATRSPRRGKEAVGRLRSDIIKPDTINVARYIFDRVKTECGDEYKLQTALFWANAEWVRRHGCTLVSAAPEKWATGPVYPKVYREAKAWSKSEVRADSATIDSEMRAVLDQAIAHVSARPWADVSDETRNEPLWIITAPNGAMTEERMVMCYAGDPPGTLAKIFAGATASL